MANDALQAFIQSDFVETERALLSLSNATQENIYDPNADIDDPRVKHNALIAQFYSKQTESSLRSFLQFIANSLPKDKRPKQIELLFTTTVLDTPSLHYLYARLGSVSIYNLAIIAYHRALVKPSERIALFLFAKIEALDDWLALRLCFLLIDIHLRLDDVAEATKDAAQAETILSNFTKAENSDDTQDTSNPSEMKNLVTNWNGRKSTTLETATDYEDAKFCLHIYNARISAYNDASRSIKEAKNAVVIAGDDENRPTSAALLVKARVEQSYSKGLRILASIITQSSSQTLLMKKVRPLTLNSLGVLHHRLGRHALAACYFEQARRCFLDLFPEDDKSEEDDNVNLNILTFMKDSHVCYNLALQYMKLSDYSRALDLFTTCARRDPLMASESSVLWIRMSECCVGLEWNGTDRKQSLVLEGQGRGRRMIMRVQDKRDELTIQYAATCARAAVAILDRQSKSKVDKGEDKKQDTEYKTQRSYTERSNQTDVGQMSIPSSTKEVQLRTSALTLLAYSSLSFDPSTTVEACNELRGIHPKGDTEHGMLGYLYAAEAFCKLNRPEDAANRLSFLFSMNVNPESSIRDAAKINLALTHAANGDLVKALNAAKSALSQTYANSKRRKSLHKEAIFAASYIFLRSGETESACALLKSLHSSRD